MIPSKMMEITTKIGCSLNCRYCPQDILVQSYKNRIGAPLEMSLETFRKCMDKIPIDVEIHFSGMCEPWLNSECTKMIKYAYALGHKIHIYTTLVGMKKNDYDELKRIAVDRFVLHIPDNENNSKFVFSKEYLDLLDCILNDVKRGEFTIDRFSCHGKVHSSFEKRINELPIPVNSNMFNRAGNVKEKCDIVSNVIHEGRIQCRWCGGDKLDRNVLLPNGEAILCCMDYGLEYSLGNLLEQTFEYIDEGALKRRYRHLLKSEKSGDIICRRCHRALRCEEE